MTVLNNADAVMLGSQEVDAIYLSSTLVWRKWQIGDLFANGEQGALYYFTEDFAGLYQAAADANPVTAVGQPVGLMLDRRFGLARGPELGHTSVSIGDIVVQNGQVVVDDLVDRYRLTRTETGKSYIHDIEISSASVIAGACYEVELDILATGASNNAWSVVYNGGATALLASNYTAASNRRTIGIATGAGNGKLLFRVAVSRGSNPRSSVAGDWVEIGKTFSVRELPGNHASQDTTAARPKYWIVGGKAAIAFDGVDDVLKMYAATAPGTCTVVRSVPGVGAEITTGVSVGTSHNLTQSFHGLLIVNRALTPQETTYVTKWANALAGVTP